MWWKELQTRLCVVLGLPGCDRWFSKLDSLEPRQRQRGCHARLPCCLIILAAAPCTLLISRAMTNQARESEGWQPLGSTALVSLADLRQCNRINADSKHDDCKLRSPRGEPGKAGDVLAGGCRARGAAVDQLLEGACHSSAGSALHPASCLDLPGRPSSPSSFPSHRLGTASYRRSCGGVH